MTRHTPRLPAASVRPRPAKALREEVYKIFSPEVREGALFGWQILYMARECGIDAPLWALRKFADLVRADMLSEEPFNKIHAEAVKFFPQRLPIMPPEFKEEK